MSLAQRFKLTLRNAFVSTCRLMGSNIRDARTGKRLTRGLVCAWEGSVHVIGAEMPLIPVPVMQRRLTYWRQLVGFTTHPPVDFERRDPAIEMLAASRFTHREPNPLVVILDHRPARQVRPLLESWAATFAPRDAILLAFGGP